jgi:predicted amidohydrolase
MREVTIAAVQMKPVLGSTEENLVKMSSLIRKVATEQRVDLIVFPELATTGFENGVRFVDLAQRVPGPAVNLLTQRATDYGVHLLFGMPTKQRVESIIYNSAVLIGPEGDLYGEYRKVHLKGEERLPFREGFKYRVFETDFGLLGVMLGWDLSFPEVARSLALEGAEIICCLANWERQNMHEWRVLATARALENACFVTAVNRVGEDVTLTFGGDSAIIDPFGQIMASMADTLDEESGQPAEGYCVARINLDIVREAREETHAFQVRKPETYRALVKRY